MLSQMVIAAGRLQGGCTRRIMLHPSPGTLTAARQCSDAPNHHSNPESINPQSTEPRASSAQVFDCLPAAALVGADIFCVHGGLSPKLTCPADVDSIKRPCALIAERDDLLSDLTWSDPSPKISGAPLLGLARRRLVTARCSFEMNDCHRKTPITEGHAVGIYKRW